MRFRRRRVIPAIAKSEAALTRRKCDAIINRLLLADDDSANAHDVDLAVKSARRAHNNVWSKMSGRERGATNLPPMNNS